MAACRVLSVYFMAACRVLSVCFGETAALPELARAAPDAEEIDEQRVRGRVRENGLIENSLEQSYREHP